MDAFDFDLRYPAVQHDSKSLANEYDLKFLSHWSLSSVNPCRVKPWASLLLQQ